MSEPITVSPQPPRHRIPFIAILFTGFSLAVLLIGTTVGILLERELLADGGSSAGFDQLDAVVDIIEDDYFYRPPEGEDTESFDQRLQQSAIDGMLASLDDSYTVFLQPPDARSLENTLEGRGVGIGVEFFNHRNQVTIARVYPETPAEENGLRAGDIVIRIDGQPVDASQFDRFLQSVQGTEGSKVRLTLQRPGQGGTFEVTLERREYTVPSVTFRMIDDTDVGWLQIQIFGANTTAEVDAALVAAEEAGASAIILDLRGNGGGWVKSAQEVLGRFVEQTRGPALYEDFSPGRGDETEKPIISGGETRFDLPVVVLTDGNTASAAEIVAGALKDYDRAMVIGETTFGKGSVQRVYEFDDGSSLRVTVAEWLTPSKGRIQDEGINPDLRVTAADPATSTVDAPLQAAVTVLEQGRFRPSDLADVGSATPVASPSPMQ
jgi:carboxyl-terminal processing protease